VSLSPSCAVWLLDVRLALRSPAGGERGGGSVLEMQGHPLPPLQRWRDRRKTLEPSGGASSAIGGGASSAIGSDHGGEGGRREGHD
jgi:hypothetical protein